MGKNQSLSRRGFLQGAAVASIATAAGGRPSFAAAKPIKIGYVSPKTGPLAPFAVADQFVIDEIGRWRSI